MTSAPSIVALVAVRNEADIIRESVGALNAAGVAAYIIDDGCEDGTLEYLRSLVGHGVLGLETLPPCADFSLTRLLKRKEQLFRDLDADWFINHDADEFRDSPWPGLTLAEAIARVDEAGFNAIDFALFDFWPVDDSEPPPDGVQSHLRHCETGRIFNRVQVRCWKRTSATVDLVSSGGHDVQFDGRRVFPFRFLLRHYPVRSVAHGRRKVLVDRLPRYAADERAAGWHVQYDSFGPESSFARRPEELEVFDANTARLAVAQEDTARVTSILTGLERQVDALRAECDAAQEAAAHRQQQVDELRRALDDAHQRRAELETQCATRQADVQAAQTALTQAHDHLADAHAGGAALQAELRRLYESRTWRWTSGLRRIARAFGLE